MLLLIENEQGVDFLDPAVDGHLDISRINHYYLIDGQKILQYHANLDAPKMMKIVYREEHGRYGLLVFLNVHGEHGSYNSSLIEYDGYPADTIKIQLNNSSDPYLNLGYSKVWINGEMQHHLSQPIVLVK